MKQYKFKIDQKALSDFYMKEQPSEESLKAIKMVVTAVTIKHFNKFFDNLEDYYSLCLCKLMETKSRYDPSYSAYNFVYSQCRNEIGNYIRKNREVYVPDILPISNASEQEQYSVELPQEIKRFYKHLTGQEDFIIQSITKKEAMHLAIYILQHVKTRKYSIPLYIKPDDIKILYKLLVR